MTTQTTSTNGPHSLSYLLMWHAKWVQTIWLASFGSGMFFLTHLPCPFFSIVYDFLFIYYRFTYFALTHLLLPPPQQWWCHGMKTGVKPFCSFSPTVLGRCPFSLKFMSQKIQSINVLNDIMPMVLCQVKRKQSCLPRNISHTLSPQPSTSSALPQATPVPGYDSVHFLSRWS